MLIRLGLMRSCWLDHVMAQDSKSLDELMQVHAAGLPQ